MSARFVADSLDEFKFPTDGEIAGVLPDDLGKDKLVKECMTGPNKGMPGPCPEGKGEKKPVATKAAVKAPPPPAAVLSAMSKIDPAVIRGSIVSTTDLRAAFPNHTKAEFDSFMVKLVEQGVLALHEHDFPSSLTPKELAGLVKYGEHYYNVVSVRDEYLRKGALKESRQFFLPRQLMSEPKGLSDVLSMARAFIQARHELTTVTEEVKHTNVTVNIPPQTMNVAASVIPAPHIDVHVSEQTHAPAPQVHVDVHVPEQQPPNITVEQPAVNVSVVAGPVEKTIERDADGEIIKVVERPIE